KPPVPHHHAPWRRAGQTSPGNSCRFFASTAKVVTFLRFGAELPEKARVSFKLDALGKNRPVARQALSPRNVTQRHVPVTRFASLPRTFRMSSPVPGMTALVALAGLPGGTVSSGLAGSFSSAPDVGSTLRLSRFCVLLVISRVGISVREKMGANG